VVEADQTVTYTPAAGWAGADAFTYRLDDQHGGVATAVATVTTANAAPDANDDMINTPPNTPVAITVLDNDTDPNTDPTPDTLSVTAVTQPPVAEGAVSLTGNVVTFTPKAAFAGLSVFTYTVTDGRGGTATANVSVYVANALPTAADDLLSVPYSAGTPVLVPVLGNDRDPNGDTIVVSTVSVAVPSGIATIVAGSVYYTPLVGFSGDATFTYDISDGHVGGTSTGRVTVTIGNAAPTAAPFTVTTDYRTPLILDVLAAATDPNGDPRRVAGVTDPAHGTVVRDPGGTITYTPDIAFSGPDGFSYTVDDGHGGTATAAVTVTVANGVAVAWPDHATAPGGVPTVIDVLANDDGDPNGQPLTVTVDVPPLTGGVSIGVDRRITYTPVTAFVGDVTFHYQLDDLAGGVTGATVTVTMVNTAPTARPDAAITDTGTAVTIAVLATDDDPNGDPLTIAGMVDGAHGTVTATAGVAGALTYTPDPGFYGTDSFLYSIADWSGLTDSAIVTVTVRNAPPVAVDDGYTVRPEVAVPLAVLANDHDPNTGQALRVASVGPAAKGTVTLAGDGTVTYRADAGTIGADGFTYVLIDDMGSTDTAGVAITIDGPPVPAADAASTAWETAVDIPVTANDVDPEAGALAVTGVSTPGHGAATVISGGTVRYQPDTGFTGPDAFSYVLLDLAGNTATGQVSVQVTHAPPLALPDGRSTPYRWAVTVAVLANDVDPGGSLAIASVSQPADGTVTFTPAAVTYTPPDGFAGIAQFGYTAVDNLGYATTGVVTVTVGAAPVVPDKAVTGLLPGAGVSITPPQTDQGGRPVVVRAIGQPAHGTAVLNADGTIRYTPHPGFAGVDIFTYEVVDVDGNVAQASIIVTVPAPGQAPPPITPPPISTPPATNPSTTTPPTTTSPTTTSPATSPPAPTPPTTKPSTTTPPTTTSPTTTSPATSPPATSPPAPTPPTTKPSTTTPPTTTSPATTPPVTPPPVTRQPTTPPPITEPPITEPPVTRPPVTTTPTTPPLVNRPPIAADDSVTVVSGDVVVLRPAFNDRDSDGDPVTIVRMATPRHGAATAGPGGTVRYTVAAGFRGGVDSFAYTIGDGRGGVATATVTIFVIANDGIMPVTGSNALALAGAGLFAATAGGLLRWLGAPPRPEDRGAGRQRP
jgi:hypothetical protein